VVIRGQGGVIRTGARRVARIADWSLRRDDTTATVTAAVEDVQQVWWTHGARFTVAVEIGARRWRWDLHALPPAAAIVTLALTGPPQIE
jgi:hypothetical protein